MSERLRRTLDHSQNIGPELQIFVAAIRKMGCNIAGNPRVVGELLDELKELDFKFTDLDQLSPDDLSFILDFSRAFCNDRKEDGTLSHPGIRFFERTIFKPLPVKNFDPRFHDDHETAGDVTETTALNAHTVTAVIGEKGVSTPVPVTQDPREIAAHAIRVLNTDGLEEVPVLDPSTERKDSFGDQRGVEGKKAALEDLFSDKIPQTPSTPLRSFSARTRALLLAAVGAVAAFGEVAIFDRLLADPVADDRTCEGPNDYDDRKCEAAPFSEDTSEDECPQDSSEQEASPVLTATLVSEQFAGEQQAALKTAVTTNQLVEDLYVYDGHPTTWEGVKEVHPWNVSAEAWDHVREEMTQWGGYGAPLLVVEACGAQTIDEALACVKADPYLAPSTAFRMAKQISLIADPVVNSDQKAVLAMHEEMREKTQHSVEKVRDEAEAGHLEAPKPFHPPVLEAKSTVQMGSADLMSEDVLDLANAELPDVSEFLEAIEGPDSDAQKNLLFKKARGKNREKVGALVDHFQQSLAQFEDEQARMTPAEILTRATEIRAQFFAELSTFGNGDGKYKAEYLRKYSAEAMQVLASKTEDALRYLGTPEAMQAWTHAQTLAVIDNVDLFRKA